MKKSKDPGYICNLLKHELGKVESANDWELLFKAQFLQNSRSESFVKDKYPLLLRRKEEFLLGKNDKNLCFKSAWSLQGMGSSFIRSFDEKLPDLFDEIKRSDDISSFLSFFRKHCSEGKKHHFSFCTKLWHCFHPDKFPIYDSNIGKILKITQVDNEDKIYILIEGYNLYLKNQKDKKLAEIRKALHMVDVDEGELSDFRVIDMGLFAANLKVPAHLLIYKSLAGLDLNILKND